MKQCEKRLTVVPCGAVSEVVGEVATAGVAAQAQNVREVHGGLQVVGVPSATGVVLTAGERLLLVDAAGRVLTVAGGTVYCDGVAVTALSSEVTAAHSVGDWVVLVTTAGNFVLRHDGTQYVVLDVADAIPRLQLVATDESTLTATLDPLSFTHSMSQWSSPLSSSDVTLLARQLRLVWRGLTTAAAGAGRCCGPVMARYAVRLWDDSLVWMSEAVRLDGSTQDNAAYIDRAAVVSGGAYSGVDAATVQLRTFKVGVQVTSGIGAAWLSLVKSIDVLVSPVESVVDDNAALDYRCVTSPTTHRQVLQLRFPPRSSQALASRLATSAVRVTLTTTDLAALSRGEWVGTEVPAGDTLTAAQCAAVGTMQRSEPACCSTTCGGRLYCCDAHGVLLASLPGNPLVAAWRHRVVDASPVALAAVSRPLYAGGFGRYPLYLFTREGIFALPQRASTGDAGEARLVAREVIDATVAPIEGNRDIYFVNRHGAVCRLRASTVDVMCRGVAVEQLGWGSRHGELWLLATGTTTAVVMPSGRMSRRTIALSQLYSDPRHCLAVDVAGRLLNLDVETSAAMPVMYQSQPIVCQPSRVLWHVNATAAQLRLAVTGERGVSCHGFEVAALIVQGDVSAPLPLRVVGPRWRTLRLEVSGTATTGDLLLPIVLTPASSPR